MDTSTGSKLAMSELQALPLEAPDGWHAAKIPFHFPADEHMRAPLYERIETVLQHLQGETASRKMVCLQLTGLRAENAVKQIAAHGRSWKPEMGLGVYPEGMPPRLWTSSDFLDRNYDEPIPELMENAVLLHAHGSDAQEACRVMTGAGGLIQVLHSTSIAAVQGAWYDLLQPTIAEPGLAGYSVYLPMLSEGSMSDPEKLLRMLQPIESYIREDAKAGEIFLISRMNLDAALLSAGLLHLKAASDRTAPARVS